MEYFEDLAELIESEEDTSYEEIYEELEGTLSEDMGDILENYMEELLNAIPDEEQELYMLVENMKTGMLFLCENIEDDSTRSQLAEELERFKTWYTKDLNCKLNGSYTTVIDAVATARANKITGENANYDFTGALDFELKDFNYSIGSFDKIDILESAEDDGSN